LPHNNSMKKPIDELFFLNKLSRFCAYQERSEKEVRNKLNLLQCPENWQLTVVESLKQSDFLNEDRFIKAFVEGKQNMKSWGKQKIFHKLLEKGISKSTAENALSHLETVKYRNTLEKLLEKKWKLLNTKDMAMSKLIRFALGKGYSFEDIQSVINKLEYNKKPSR